MLCDENIIKRFCELASINALSQYEKPVAEYIAAFAEQNKIPYCFDDSSTFTGSDTGNIILEVNGGGEKILLSHMDTARATQNLNIIIDDEKISSDGNTVLGVDNRAGIAAILSAVESAVSEPSSYDGFYAAFVTCEETTLAGSRYLKIPENVNEGFIFDSYLRPGKLITSSFGAAGFRVKITGKAAHSGISPEKGINALSAAVKIIKEIPVGRVNRETTINIGKIAGGTAVNVVPEYVEFEGEVRSSGVARVEELIYEIEEKIKHGCDFFGCRYEFEFRWDFKPFKLPENAPIKNVAKKAVEEAELEYEELTSMGGSDANSLNERGIHSLNFGIGAQNPHSNDEFIYLVDLQKSFEIAKNLVKK